MRKIEKKFLSIRHKLLWIFLPVTLMALVAYFSFFHYYTNETALQNYEQQLNIFKNSLTNNIDYYVNTCVKASRSIYYNNAAKALLTNRGGNFSGGETKDSNELFSYMLSVYAAIPSAKQIHLSAHRLGYFFLLTTDDLVHYTSARGYTDIDFAPENLRESNSVFDNSVWVESTHQMQTYGHFVSPRADYSAQVFTVHVPIYDLPQSDKMIGLLSVDISINYIADNCSFAKDEGAEIYIVDDTGAVVYAQDNSQIGQTFTALGAEDLLTKGDRYIQDGNLVLSRSFGSNYYRWHIYLVTPLSHIYESAYTSQFVLVLVFSVYIVVLGTVLLYALLRYMRPLNKIATLIRANISGNAYNQQVRLSDSINYTANDEVGVLRTSIDAMLDTIDGFVLRQYQMALANKEAQLRALQAQINPHFIYNSLQCIASKTLENGDVDSYNYIASFGQMLQYAMKTDHNMVPLREEVDHVRRYVFLQKMRFEGNIDFRVEVSPAAQEFCIPKMALQPLAENSISHGKLFSGQTGRLELFALVENGRFLITIADNGVAIAPEIAVTLSEDLEKLRLYFVYQEQLSGSRNDRLGTVNREDLLLSTLLRSNTSGDEHDDHHGHHIGIQNVYLRFLLKFGADCHFSISANEMGGTTVCLNVPCPKSEKEVHTHENPDCGR